MTNNEFHHPVILALQSHSLLFPQKGYPMHLALRRAYVIRPNTEMREPGPNFATHANAVQAAVLNAVRVWLGKPDGLEVPPNSDGFSPRTQWHEGDRSVAATLWRDPTYSGQMLLECEMRDRNVAGAASGSSVPDQFGKSTSRPVAGEIKLQLGGNPSTGLWLSETQHIEDPNLDVVGPNIAAALRPFFLFDRDGRRTGAPLSILESDKPRLLDNLYATRDERSLPVILISYTPEESWKIDVLSLAEKLVGLARVAFTKPPFRWTKVDFPLLVFGGGVRLYAPGLTSTNP